MKKVALRRAEYMATLPPYRFEPGDVIEIDDDWADQMVRRGIAKKAPANAQTAQEKRQMMRDEADDVDALDRAGRRAALQAQLNALDQEERAAPDGGHFSDMITREDMGGDAQQAEDDKTASKSASARK